jgi:ketosteroid isomerase-like protein
MKPQTTEMSAHRQRSRMPLYITIVFAISILVLAVVRARQGGADEETFRALTDSYCAAWSTLDANAPAKFYAKDDGLVFYDLAPFSYHGWKEYHDGVQKEFFTSMVGGSLIAGKDLKVTRHGTIAWTTVTMHFNEKTKDGKTGDADVRYTGIWEKRGGDWLLVHEHLSVPMP